MLRNPFRSTRRHAIELGLNKRTARRILYKNSGLHPHKMTIVLKLNIGDYAQRAAFPENMLAIFEDNDNAVIMTSDEFEWKFNLNGVVNKQNYNNWILKNPRNLHQRPLHSPKITICSAISRRGIIGPYFFMEKGIAVTVNCDRYINMMNNFLDPELRRRRISRHNFWFQQDGATTYNARVPLEAIRPLFPNRVISKLGDIISILAHQIYQYVTFCFGET